MIGSSRANIFGLIKYKNPSFFGGFFLHQNGVMECKNLLFDQYGRKGKINLKGNLLRMKK